MDKKKVILIALIAAGALLCIVNNDYVRGIGAILIIAGIVLIVKANKAKKQDSASAAEPKVRYIANPTTKVFHYPYCESLKSLADVKFTVLTVPRQRLEKEGYKPCKKCNP